MNLNSEQPVFERDLGGTTVRYTLCPRTGIVEFTCYPTALAPQLVPQREFLTGPQIDGLPARWKPIHAQSPEWLVPFKLGSTSELGGHQNGRSQRGAPEMEHLAFDQLEPTQTPTGEEIVLTLRHRDGYRLRHVLRWRTGDAFFRVHSELLNDTTLALTLDYLPGFSLGGLTPFHPGEAPEALRLHRFRTAWSAEGRHESLLLEDLHLERSWGNFSRRSERFGQIGSLPIRGFFPWAAIEDTAVGVMWGAQLSAPGSWHLEVCRAQDKVTLSGGLPSRDFGEWWKVVKPGEVFATPTTVLACVRGDIDDLCAALTSAQIEAADRQPTCDRELPVIFNEWCSSWGVPTHENVMVNVQELAQTPVGIFVIDDGWAAKPEGRDIQCNGDWVVDEKKFPSGLKPTCDAIRRLGLIPGLWFELEAATDGTRAFDEVARHLHRHGRVIQIGSRHFWDLRDPLTCTYLAEKVIGRLRDDGFGYLKIDYNDTLPAGVDGAESPGEGLRQHLAAVQEFIAHIRRELPEVLIENCASGGHRLEPSFQALCAMGSFSDAHETLSIPIIAANLHRLILPRQSQVWCVVHPSDTRTRLRYGLAATLLGRVCLSGEYSGLNADQRAEIADALQFYREAAPIIRDGVSRIHRGMGASWNDPHGWQVVVRRTAETLLVVANAFGDDRSLNAEIPLPSGFWRIRRIYGDEGTIHATGDHLSITPAQTFSAVAVIFDHVPNLKQGQ